METPAQEPEAKLWTGHPSQFLAFGKYLLWTCILIAGIAAGVMIEQYGQYIAGVAIVISLVIMLHTFLRIRCLRFELTSERILITQGILSKSTEELELFRVKDSKLLQPISQRILGLGTIELVTSDASTPVLLIPAIRGAADVREMMRQHVNAMRDRKKVREIDME